MTTWSSPVQPAIPPITRNPLIPRKEWYPQRSAEKSAFFEMVSVFLQCVRCLLCDIWIGPGHYEQEVYLCPLHNEAVLCYINHHESMYTIGEGTILLPCCSTCAQRRSLPLTSRLITHEHWTTTALLGDHPVRPSTAQDMSALVAQARALVYIFTSWHWFLLVTLFYLHIPIEWVFCYSARRGLTNTPPVHPSLRLGFITHPQMN